MRRGRTRKNKTRWKAHFSNPLRVFCQEQLKSVKLLRNSLNVIQSIYSDDQLDTVESLLELLDSLLNRRSFQALSNRTRTSSENQFRFEATRCLSLSSIKANSPQRTVQARYRWGRFRRERSDLPARLRWAWWGDRGFEYTRRGNDERSRTCGIR